MTKLLFKAVLALSLLVLFYAAGFGIARWWVGPKVTIVQGPGNTTTVTIDRPVLTPGATVYVTDTANAKKLLAENAALKNQITVLTETMNSLTATGSGSVVFVDRPVPGQTVAVREGDFRDFRLHFSFQGDKAQYELTQQFEALVAAGRNVEGRPIATVNLFEVGPGEIRTPLTTTKTTIVAANPGVSRWSTGLNVVAGAAVSDLKTPGVVAGVRWLTRGPTKAAEDGKYAFLTPVLVFSSTRNEPGLLPVSVNLGQIPHQPFKDLWLSPYVTASGRFGVAVTATF